MENLLKELRYLEMDMTIAIIVLINSLSIKCNYQLKLLF